jgi:hypothetical protein
MYRPYAKKTHGYEMTINDNKEDLRQKSCHLPQMLMMKVHYLWCLEEMKNLNQMQQPVEELLWLAHVISYGHALSIIRNKHWGD